VIVFNKSHSGSRLLAELLSGQGIFIGSVLNESLDAVPFVPLVERVVLDHYPDFSGLWRDAEWPAAVQDLLAEALEAHLALHPRGAPWGWKLCETTFMLPLLAPIFPGARFIHLIRDGRDVAFADHVAPGQAFWRKVYFGTDAVRSWGGMRLDHAAYERGSHLFNARHWQESVRLGRAFGAMLGPAYREVFLRAALRGSGGRGPFVAGVDWYRCRRNRARASGRAGLSRLGRQASRAAAAATARSAGADRADVIGLRLCVRSAAAEPCRHRPGNRAAGAAGHCAAAGPCPRCLIELCSVDI